MCQALCESYRSNRFNSRMHLAMLLAAAFLVVLVPQSATAQHFEFAYLANSTSGNISGYKLATASGSLTPVAGSPFMSGNSGPTSIAVDQGKRFLYAANQFAGDNNITGYRIEPGTGRLLSIPGSPFIAGAGPTSIAIDPAAPFVYVANFGSNNVSGFRIDENTGRPRPVPGSPYAAGTQPSFVTVDPTGKFLYITNSGSNDVTGYTIDSTNGGLTAISGSPFPAGTFPQSIAIDPLDRFAYVANGGSDDVSGFSMDAATGALTAVEGSPFAAGTGAITGVTVDPSGRYVYAAGYGGIFGYRISTGVFSPTTGPGTLTPIAGSPFGTGSNPVYGEWTPNAVTVDYTGTYVFATSGPYGAGNVSELALDSASGALTTVSGSPFPAGDGSVAIALVRPATNPIYTATQVPNPNFLPVQSISPYAINNKGEVSGSVIYQRQGGEFFASGFLYAGGTTIEIGFTRTSTAFGINDETEVVGQTALVPPNPGAPPQQAFLYSSGTLKDLDNVTGRQSAAIGINNSGQVTGSMSTGTCSLFNCSLRDTMPFSHAGSILVDIGTLGGNFSSGSGINNFGQITGGSNTSANGSESSLSVPARKDA